MASTKATKTDALIESLKVGFHAARAAAKAVPDHGKDVGGSCNFDTAYFRAPRVASEIVAHLATCARCQVFETTWMGRKYWGIYPDFGVGQGLSQTRVAEAMTKALQDAGVDARTYYALD